MLPLLCSVESAQALLCKLEDCCRSGEREAKRSKRDLTPSGNEHKGRNGERKEAHRDRDRDRERGKDKRDEKDSSKRKDRDKDREEKERPSDKKDRDGHRREDDRDRDRERERDKDREREKAREPQTEHAETKENAEERDRGRDARRSDGRDRGRDDRHRDERHRSHCLHLYLCALLKAECSCHCFRLPLWQHRKNCCILFAFGPNRLLYRGKGERARENGLSDERWERPSSMQRQDGELKKEKQEGEAEDAKPTEPKAEVEIMSEIASPISCSFYTECRDAQALC